MSELNRKKYELDNICKEIVKVDSNVLLQPIKTVQETKKKWFIFNTTYNVTGRDFNEGMEVVQKNFSSIANTIIDQNKLIEKMISYISILNSHTLVGINNAYQEAIDGRKKAEAAQHDISRTIELLKLQTERLEKFYNKVDLKMSELLGEEWQGKSQLTIDKLFQNTQKLEDALLELENYKKMFAEFSKNVSASLNEFNNKLNILGEFETKINFNAFSNKKLRDELSSFSETSNNYFISNDKNLNKINNYCDEIQGNCSSNTFRIENLEREVISIKQNIVNLREKLEETEETLDKKIRANSSMIETVNSSLIEKYKRNESDKERIWKFICGIGLSLCLTIIILVVFIFLFAFKVL